MSGLFGGKSREEREAERQQKQTQLPSRQAEVANQYDEMVTRALERLTHWAFPDSQVERQADGKWQLWHTTDDGEKYVDVTVELNFERGRPEAFSCDGPLQITTAELRNVSTIVRQLASEFREQLPPLGCSQAVGMWATGNGVGCPHTHSHYDDCGRLIQTSSGKDGGLGSPRTKRSGCAA
jgi:hypothetical protein